MNCLSIQILGWMLCSGQNVKWPVHTVGGQNLNATIIFFPASRDFRGLYWAHDPRGGHTIGMDGGGASKISILGWEEHLKSKKSWQIRSHITNCFTGQIRALVGFFVEKIQR